MTAEQKVNKHDDTFKKAIRKLGYYREHQTVMKPILDGFIYDTETMLFYGASGSGKSLFTLALAVAVSGDRGEFLGIPCAKNVKTLYVDGEMHTNTIAKRAEIFGDGGDLMYLSCTEMTMKGQTVDYCDEKQQAQLIDHVKSTGTKLVVLDSVRTLFSLSDENSAEAWKPVNHLVSMLRAFGATVICIHHSNKTSGKDGNEVTYSGSTNAITVFDRTCGVERAGPSVWSLAIGDKEGRSGDGWSYDISELCWGMSEDNKGFVKVDNSTQTVADINSYLEWLNGNLSLATKAKVMELNKRFDLRIGKSPTVKTAWDRMGKRFELWNDCVTDEEVHITDSKTFTQLLKGGASVIDGVTSIGDGDDW